ISMATTGRWKPCSGRGIRTGRPRGPRRSVRCRTQVDRAHRVSPAPPPPLSSPLLRNDTRVMRHGGRATGTIAGALGVIGLGATMVAGVLGMTAPGPAVPAVVTTAAAIAAPATDSLEQVIRPLLGLSGRLRAVSF